MTRREAERILRAAGFRWDDERRWDRYWHHPDLADVGVSIKPGARGSHASIAVRWMSGTQHIAAADFKRVIAVLEWTTRRRGEPER